MSFSISLAQIKDRPVFLELWSEYLQENRRNGSPILPSPANLRGYQQLYDSYLVGSLSGGSLIAWHEGSTPAATILAGENWEPGWETDLGKTVVVWGVYVRPAYRGHELAMRLFTAGVGHVLKMGFDSITTMVHGNNPHGERIALQFGVRAIETLYIGSLPPQET